ncbi:MAG: AAA family ATPase, partial [Actinobacteria bacterium]|nr:AAA family ATPase [Actinomycetota bacterium]
MIESATPVSTSAKGVGRKGEADAYSAITEENSRSNSVPGQLLSDVEAEQVGWLWRGRIPKGKLSIWEGDPGIGKSAATTDVAARVSVGRQWPDGAPCEAGGVVLLSAEDGLA